MTVSVTASRIAYSGDGVTVAFSYPYKFASTSDIKVVLTDEDDGIEVAQTGGGVHFTTTGTGLSNGIYASGTVTFVTAPGSDKKISIYRAPALTQETDLTAESNDELAINKRFDIIEMKLQRLDDARSRSIRLSEGFWSTFDATVPDVDSFGAVAGMAPVLAAGLTGLTWATPVAGASASAAMAALLVGTEQAFADGLDFTATGSTAARALSARFAEYCNVLDYGAAPDCTRGSTGVATNGDATFTDASAVWTAADVDKAIVVHGAGAAGVSLITTIASFNSTTSIELTIAPSTSVASNCKYIYGTDNTAAFNAAIAEALDSTTARTIFIPDGEYFFVGEVDPLDGDLRFLGQSRESTVLFFFEGNTTGAGNRYLFQNSDTDRKGDLSFDNLQLRGTLDQYARNTFGNPFYLDYYTNIAIRNCKFLNLAGAAMDLHFNLSVQVTGCVAENIGRDGIRARDCYAVSVTDNDLKRLGDDSIAVHTGAIEDFLGDDLPIPNGINIRGNTVVNGGSVKALGGRNITIANNRLRLTNAWGIVVQSLPNASSSEGNNQALDISVTDNVILDLVYLPSGVPEAATAYISIRGLEPRGSAGTNNVLPMRYNSTLGLIVRPWDHYQTDDSDSADALPPVAGLVIRGNICRRTLPNVAAYSDWGYGAKVLSTAADPAMDDTDQRPISGIHLIGDDAFNDVLIGDNIIEHTQYAIMLPESSADELGIRNMHITNNVLHDFSVRGIDVTAADAKHMGLVIEGNTIDGDYYRVASNSNINGTYDADGDPIGVDIDAAEGAIIRNNRFANVCQLVKVDTPAKNIIENNVALCGTPAAVGFDTGNKGVGNIIATGDWRYIIAECDPTAGATFNEISTILLRESATMPASGWYPQGWVVRNTSASATGVIEWVRLTTGTGHVKGTDWLPVTVGWVILGKGTVAALTGSTAETVLATVAVPADTLGPNGAIRVTAQWSYTNGADDKIPRIRFGAAGAGTGGGIVRGSAALTTTAAFRDQVEIHNINNVAVQGFHQPGIVNGGWGSNASAVSSGAINTAAASEVCITAQLENGADSITLLYYLVEAIYGA